MSTIQDRIRAGYLDETTKALMLAEAAASPGGGTSAIQSTTVAITLSQFLTLRSSPVELVPAPGAGKVLVPVRFSSWFVHPQGVIGAGIAAKPCYGPDSTSLTDGSLVPQDFNFPLVTVYPSVTPIEPGQMVGRPLLLQVEPYNPPIVSTFPLDALRVARVARGSGWAEGDTFTIDCASGYVAVVDTIKNGVPNPSGEGPLFQPKRCATNFLIQLAGSGWTEGDTFTVYDATGVVNSVDEGGGVLTCAVTYPGQYVDFSSVYAVANSGGGTGFSLAPETEGIPDTTPTGWQVGDTFALVQGANRTLTGTVTEVDQPGGGPISWSLSGGEGYTVEYGVPLVAVSGTGIGGWANIGVIANGAAYTVHLTDIGPASFLSAVSMYNAITTAGTGQGLLVYATHLDTGAATVSFTVQTLYTVLDVL